MSDPRGLRGGAQQSKEALAEFQRKSKLYARVFGTPEGKEVLKDLEDNYLRRELRSEREHDVLYKAGLHDAVLAITERVRAGNREEVTDGVV